MAAVNFDNVKNTISSSSDGEIYIKKLVKNKFNNDEEQWVEYTNTLYKGYETPSNEFGVNDDIFYNKNTYKIYKKINGIWTQKTDINIYYTDEKLSSTAGELGSINCITSILELNPLITIGNAKNIDDSEENIGLVYIKEEDKRLYLRTAYGDYRINYQREKPTQSRSIANAIIFNTDLYDDIVYRKTLYG